MRLTLIKNAHVYAPENLGLRNILLAGGKIVYVGSHTPNLDEALDAEQIDADGQAVIPGFVDGHAHITGGGGEAGFATRVPPVPLSRFTRAGVTTVVGLLGTDDLTRNTESVIAQVYALREEGLSAYCYTGGYHLPPTTLTGSVKSDIVFVEPIVGVGEVAISDHRSSQPTLNEILKIASEAHVARLMTGKAGILHLHLGDGERGLQLVREALESSEIPARTFNPTHVNRQRALFEEACELSKAGCWIDVTAFETGPEGYEPAEAVQRFLDQKLPHDKLTISSDGGGCLPHFDCQGTLTQMDFADSEAMTQVFYDLLDAGLDMQRILPVFTANVADLMNFSHKGRIAVGMDADLIMLDKQQRIQNVMAQGQWHVFDNKIVTKGTFEE